jgi:hypothetical protein
VGSAYYAAWRPFEFEHDCAELGVELEELLATVRARPSRLGGLGVSHCESGFRGGFV